MTSIDQIAQNWLEIRDNYVNTREAAKIANRTVATIRIWCAEGKVDSIQDPYSPNARYLILRSSLLDYVKGRFRD